MSNVIGRKYQKLINRLKPISSIDQLDRLIQNGKYYIYSYNVFTTNQNEARVFRVVDRKDTIIVKREQSIWFHVRKSYFLDIKALDIKLRYSEHGSVFILHQETLDHNELKMCEISESKYNAIVENFKANKYAQLQSNR